MTDFKVGDRIEMKGILTCPQCSFMEGVVAEVDEQNGVPFYKITWDPTWWVTADQIQLYEETDNV